jgi:hypothetical protein
MNKSEQKDTSTLKHEVINLLYGFHFGREHSITSKQLAARLNLRSATPVRAMIAKLRIEGQPIASSNRRPEGYYIPANIEEANECLEHLHSRVKKICMAAAGVDKGLRARFGTQMRLEMNYQDQPRFTMSE